MRTAMPCIWTTAILSIDSMSVSAPIICSLALLYSLRTCCLRSTPAHVGLPDVDGFKNMPTCGASECADALHPYDHILGKSDQGRDRLWATQCGMHLEPALKWM
jgi:hypothetical protein